MPAPIQAQPPPYPRYLGVHHVAFATQDMDRTIRFWRDLLGMRLVYGYGRLGYRQYFFEITQACLVSFFEWPQVQPLAFRRHGEPVTGPFGFDHLSIGVATDQDLWELSDRLAAADMPVSDVIDHGFIHSIYSFDPNGIPIEFSCAVSATDIHNHPLFKDAEPPQAALAGSAPVPGFWPEPEPLLPEERILVPGEGHAHFKV